MVPFLRFSCYIIVVDGLLFYSPFNSISVVQNQWKGENDRLDTVERCLLLKIIQFLERFQF